MTTSIQSIGRSIARAALAAALGLVTVSGVANADIRKEHPKYYPQELIEINRAHAAEMNSGKDHYAAWDAVHRLNRPGTVEAQAEKTRKHADAMNEGKDHAAARDAERAPR